MVGRKMVLGQRFSCYKGFNLIELTIVMAIVAILASLAVPSYRSYILRSNRSAAEQLLLQNVIYLERYYSQNGSYLDTTTNNYPSLPYSQSPTGGVSQYLIQYQGTPASSDYTLIAIPQGTQNGTNMTICVNQDGVVKELSGSSCS